jgi:hypothetical protein
MPGVATARDARRDDADGGRASCMKTRLALRTIRRDRSCVAKPHWCRFFHLLRWFLFVIFRYIFYTTTGDINKTRLALRTIRRAQ